MAFTSRSTRSVLRILLCGAAAALLVLAGGWLIGRVRLGATNEEEFARLERQVRQRLDDTIRALKDTTVPVAAKPDSLAEAAGDQAAAKRLFDLVDAGWKNAGAANDISLTAYGPSAERPLAWTGRPSEIDRGRIMADQPALFAAPGPLGLRLVYVQPVFGGDRRRAGAIAAECLVSVRGSIGAASAEMYSLSTTFAPVSLRTLSEGAGEPNRPFSFPIRSPKGEIMLEASVKPADLEHVRAVWNSTVYGLLLCIAALTLLVVIGPLLDFRTSSRETGKYISVTFTVLGLLLAAWIILIAAGRYLAHVGSLFERSITIAGASVIASPFDFLLCGLALLALVGLAFDTAERWRVRARKRREPTNSAGLTAAYVGVHLVLGFGFALLLAGYQLFLRAALAGSEIDILHFSISPWDSARLAIVVGLVLSSGALFWLGILLFRVGMTGWRPSRDVGGVLLPAIIWLVALATATGAATVGRLHIPWVATALIYIAVVASAAMSRKFVPRFRHASQALRLILSFCALLLPSIVMYPTLVQFAEQSNRRLIEGTFAPEVINQREAIKTYVANAMDQVDGIPGLPDVVEAAAGQPPDTRPAFWVWSQTDLRSARIASAIELYGADGTLVSRFALYLPEYKSSAMQLTREQKCDWDLYEYVSPFGSEQRKLLRAARAICVERPGGQPVAVGSIVIHAMLDYSALPFLSSQSPYYELLRPAEVAHARSMRGNLPGGDLDLAVYGWSRTPIYTSATVSWPLGDILFNRIYKSREPFWTRIESGGETYNVYLMNDRGGVYALGYPTIPIIGHFVNIAELATLVALVFVGMVAGSVLFTLLSGHQPTSGRALLREIRASFYRKLFLAFVAVSIIPVITLAFVAQAYIGGRLVADTEAAAIKTTAVAQRVIEDTASIGTLQQAAAPREGTSVVEAIGTMFGDDVMVGLSRIIDQDVNMFQGPQLVATSERDLFESQLLPTRTPADVYRAITLDRRQSFVGQERTGDFTYMLAAAPVRLSGRDSILTVPLMLRQHEIDREMDEMNRRIVLATLLFILMGAAIGYPMAERIADPVNRLTRATRRIARGELDARIAATSSDELRRLVEAFNSMAADLQRQRGQLERTNRLEAWAEMARQVAHEIKNPLTPIQLSAEHLQRVHSDRGRPLSPILDECVTSILAQVRLLRQIAGEFSSFASSPTARPVSASIADLVEEVVGPYRSGLSGRVQISVDVPQDLPGVYIDRVLVGRALANIIENALHAMPGTGSLAIHAAVAQADGRPFVRLSVTDTGVGMDDEALGRLFEPYFSTKAIGTGLGLAIAKRNVELIGGSIDVESEKGRGTTVRLHLPIAEERAAI